MRFVSELRKMVDGLEQGKDDDTDEVPGRIVISGEHHIIIIYSNAPITIQNGKQNSKATES